MSKFVDFIYRNKTKQQRLSYKPNFWYQSLFNIQFLNIVVLLAICLTGIFYLVKINNMAVKGFKLKELEEKQAILKENIKKTELQIADLQSMQRMQERINNLNMLSVVKVEYVVSSGAMAFK